MSATDTEWLVKLAQTRTARAFAVLAVILEGFIFALSIAAGSPLACVPAILLVAALVLVVVQTRLIGTMKRTRELSRPRMTPEDYRQLREMETELGWELSEMPAAMVGLPPESPRTAACDCGECRTEAARDFDEQLREQVIASQGIPPALLYAPPRSPTSGTAALVGSGFLSAKARMAEVTADAARSLRAAEHFAELAIVGREHCLSYCPICAERLTARMNWRAGIPPDDIGSTPDESEQQ